MALSSLRRHLAFVFTVPVLCGVLAATFSAREQPDAAAIEKWRGILGRAIPAEERLAARDDLAKRQAAAAIALLHLGHPESVWPLLRHAPDPSRRSYLIRDIGRSGVRADLIVGRLEDETDVSARRALILVLGQFDGDQLPLAVRKPLASQLLLLYRNDPDPGVHSAIDWLLRHSKQGLEDRRFDWNEAQTLRVMDDELAGQPPSGRHWFVTAEGHTLAIVQGPVEFAMGSPAYDTYRPKGPEEAQHRVRIVRSFGVSTKEVTVAQFQRFLEANPAVRRAAQTDPSRDPSRGSRTLSKASPEEDCPQVTITWFEAAQYCNWLSRREGIPEEEWVYPSLDRIKEGMELPKGYLTRTGYRLPTEAEWEFAARAGATTMRFYGSSEELLREYAWYGGTTFAERSWPVGQLKPNDLGLFDIYGNVWEWIQDLWKQYPSGPMPSIRLDAEDATLMVSAQYPRPRRGGSYSYEAPFLRSANRGRYIPDERRDSVGFRIARTVR
jgi:hypothetical protein